MSDSLGRQRPLRVRHPEYEASSHEGETSIEARLGAAWRSLHTGKSEWRVINLQEVHGVT